jgi:hypothetical protein
MSCFGNGKCITVCNKKCSNQDHELSNSTLFCKTKCENECELIPCKNNLHCKSKFPSYFFKENNGFVINDVCVECNVFNITFLNEKRKCFLCSRPKYMIVTNCHHELCFECLFNIHSDIVHCPFCGTEIELN